MRWHLLHGAISEANLGSHCCVRSGWHSIAVWFAHPIFRFPFSFVILVHVLVRSASCNFYSYIVFVSQIVIVLVFILTERSAIGLILVFVFVFVTKIALHAERAIVQTPLVRLVVDLLQRFDQSQTS